MAIQFTLQNRSMYWRLAYIVAETTFYYSFNLNNNSPPWLRIQRTSASRRSTTSTLPRSPSSTPSSAATPARSRSNSTIAAFESSPFFAVAVPPLLPPVGEQGVALLPPPPGEGVVDRGVEKLLGAVREGDVQMVKLQLGWLELELEHPECEAIDVTRCKVCHPLCQCDKCFLVQKVNWIVCYLATLYFDIL